MFYHVCVQNCIEDYFYENVYCGKYNTKEEAVASVTSEDFNPPVFDVNGYIRWFFPSCDTRGILNNPSVERDQIECYQIINVIPSEREEECINEDYGNDLRSVFNLSSEYLLYYSGAYKRL